MILFVLPSHGHICPNPQDLLYIQCGLLIPAKIVLVCLLAKTSLRTNHGKQQGLGNSVEIESTV